MDDKTDITIRQEEYTPKAPPSGFGWCPPLNGYDLISVSKIVGPGPGILYHALASLAGLKEDQTEARFYATDDRLAAKLGISVRTFEKQRKALEKARLLIPSPRQKKKDSKYTLINIRFLRTSENNSAPITTQNWVANDDSLPPKNGRLNQEQPPKNGCLNDEIATQNWVVLNNQEDNNPSKNNQHAAHAVGGEVAQVNSERPKKRNPKQQKKSDYPDGFDAFWKAYPPRNGRKLEKRKALTEWKKLSQEARRNATRAAAIYAEESDFIKDAFRWLRDRSFEDWLEKPLETKSADPSDGLTQNERDHFKIVLNYVCKHSLVNQLDPEARQIACTIVKDYGAGKIAVTTLAKECEKLGKGKTREEKQQILPGFFKKRFNGYFQAAKEQLKEEAIKRDEAMLAEQNDLLAKLTSRQPNCDPENPFWSDLAALCVMCPKLRPHVGEILSTATTANPESPEAYFLERLPAAWEAVENRLGTSTR
ncbi:hypothetical protein AB1K70_17025 [Bremerella sp. JC770]|uniref:hypothetical protein n=1 Tax=Bremerella sp. JC770 TaxID=3232137 RepID=UPI00345935BD